MGPGAADDDDLDGTAWRLVAFRPRAHREGGPGRLDDPADAGGPGGGGQHDLATVPPAVSVTLELAGGVAAGSGGCNRYRGPYHRTGARGFTFGALAMTRMACLGAAGEVEDAYVVALAQVASLTRDDPGLVLRDAAGRVLLAFAPATGEALSSSA